jgi:hypothetical protein
VGGYANHSFLRGRLVLQVLCPLKALLAGLLSHISLGDNGEQRFVSPSTVERFDGILRCDSTVMPGTTSSYTLLEFGDSALSMHFEDTEGRAAFTMYIQLLYSFPSND